MDRNDVFRAFAAELAEMIREHPTLIAHCGR